MIVTGGAGVIGQAICRRLLQSDYVPVAADLKPAVDELDLHEAGLDGALAVAMDVSDRGSVAEAVGSVIADGETVAGLVNCAGILRDSFLGRSTTLTYSGANAVVTGAASGIGAATAATLMSAGIRTIRLDIRQPDPDPRYGEDLQVCCAADVRDPGVVAVLQARGVDTTAISYLVNCAGIIDNTGFTGVTREQWTRCLEVNLIGAYNLIDALTPSLRAGGAGAVVNITSIEAHRVIALSDPDPTPQYAASKAGLRMLTQTSARALAADGVRVNSVSPGFVATPMAATHGDTSSLPPTLATRVPAGRFARPDEIASAAAFLLSDQATYITGSDLRVDGGFELT